MIKDDGGPHHHHPPQDLCLHLLPLCQEPGPGDPAVGVELHRHSVAPARHLRDHFQDDDTAPLHQGFYLTILHRWSLGIPKNII